MDSPLQIPKKSLLTTPRPKLQPLHLQHQKIHLSNVMDGNLPSGRGHDYTSSSVVSQTSSSGIPLSARGITNFKLIRNAICHVCLAGPINNANKEKALAALERFPQSNFVILFHSSSALTFRGLYRLEEIYPNNNQHYHSPSETNHENSPESNFSAYPNSSNIDNDDMSLNNKHINNDSGRSMMKVPLTKIQGKKIFGSGPSYIREEWIECFYKYNSAGRKFQKLPATRSLTVMTDGISVDHQTIKRIKSLGSTHHHVGNSN